MFNTWHPTCPVPKSSLSQSQGLQISQDLHIKIETGRFITNASINQYIDVKLIRCLIQEEEPKNREMQSTKEKLSNMASAAKEHIDIYKAKIDEKAEKATARTEEEKVIAHESAKAKEAKAKMELHEAKARHAAEKLGGKQPHHLVGAHQHGMNHPGYGAAPVPENSYPPAGNYPMNTHI